MSRFIIPTSSPHLPSATVRPLWLVLGALLVCAFVSLVATPVQAAFLSPSTTYTVTKTADTNDGACDADCSLREAVRAANAAPDADTIILPAGYYNLTIRGADEDAAATGDFDLTGSVNIVGAGAGSTIIDGLANDRVFHILSGATVTISGVTIKNGLAAVGAAILNEGTLDLNDSVVAYNHAQSSAGSGMGGGIDTRGASVLNLNGCTVRENTSLQYGGGIFIDAGSTVTIKTSAILTNSVSSSGSPRNVFGGGIHNGGHLTIVDSTIGGNTAFADNVCPAGCSTYYKSSGGGIANGQVATLVNTTVNRNAAWYRSTASGFSAGLGAGVFNQTALYLENTILAKSIGFSAEVGNCAGSVGAFTSYGNNLDSGNTCGMTDPTDKVNTDPLLGSLKTYGSTPPVYPLQSGSPAIDGGHTTEYSTSDQRGFPRPFDGNGDGTATYDIGAFEFGSYPVTVTLASSANPSVVGQSVTFTATLSSPDGAPGGTVAFKDGSVVLCSAVSIGGGKAICTFAFNALGLHTITATYGGDNWFGASTGTLSGGQTVNKAGSTTTLTAHLPTPSDPGQPVTVNYTVVASAPGSATPSGNVTVSDGVDSCTASVAAGTCTLTLGTAGTRTLTATYAGNGSLLGSTSTPVSHVVGSPVVGPDPQKLYIPMLVR